MTTMIPEDTIPTHKNPHQSSGGNKPNAKPGSCLNWNEPNWRCTKPSRKLLKPSPPWKSPRLVSAAGKKHSPRGKIRLQTASSRQQKPSERLQSISPRILHGLHTHRRERRHPCVCAPQPAGPLPSPPAAAWSRRNSSPARRRQRRIRCAWWSRRIPPPMWFPRSRFPMRFLKGNRSGFGCPTAVRRILEPVIQ